MLNKTVLGVVTLAAAAISSTAMADDRGFDTAAGAVVGAAIGAGTGSRNGARIGLGQADGAVLEFDALRFNAWRNQNQRRFGHGHGI